MAPARSAFIPLPLGRRRKSDEMSDSPRLSLVIPCYNEENTLKGCVERCLGLAAAGIHLEIIIVDDHSTDQSLAIARTLAASHPGVTVLEQPCNMGKGAALQAGFMAASGDYVGVQDADMEYDPMDYLELLKPLVANKADIVYGSRYLKTESRRVLRFWHTLMNRSLTFLSNMFTNLDLTDMETCYKLFTRDAIRQIAPLLREKRFGFEPEVTELVGRHDFRVYECAIHYNPRSMAEGKKIGWMDGVRALYCILHYGAPYAPLPMQALLYLFIGIVCGIANIGMFALFNAAAWPLAVSAPLAFLLAAALNYLLCIAILFRHKARWSTGGELAAYVATISVMCLVDYLCTASFIWLGLAPVWAKAWATLIGFVGNFLLRKYYVF